MSEDQTASHRDIPVLGDPDDTTGDFATEHQETTVDDDADEETESPRGQPGLGRDDQPN